ncbi:MAG: hypothetical protein N2316_01895 [Spirochaetes bacterium]|nr:hypothetical protein [Spirochaetota bacterium]
MKCGDFHNCWLKLALLLFLIYIPFFVYAIDFDELDLPPAGAHSGQMLLGFFVTAGFASGSLIDAEKDFIRNSTFTFENETTKLIEVSHLPLSVGLFCEYMPIDYVGLRCRFRRNWIIQRSTFGTEYANVREIFFSDYSIILAPAFHVTNRKQWDVSVAPIVGYAFYQYQAAAVAGELLENTASQKRKGKGVVYGCEIGGTIFFSGGLFVSLGYEWIRNSVEYAETFYISNPQTSAIYPDTSGGDIQTHSVLIVVGYAFSN